MKKKFGEYYVGLDIGTESVGWAVTDTDYNILKFNKNAMWGVRLFDEADTAETRRLKRTERRRNDRRKWRIRLLQELFAEEIDKIDENFFLRLKESKFYPSDKYESGNQTNTLFNDVLFKDKEYHEKYETIYHLRKALIDGDEEAFKDPRLLYLACHHIIKNRGHFLISGELNAVLGSIEGELESLAELISNEFEIEFKCSDTEKLKALLSDRNATINDKKKAFKDLFTDGSEDKDTKKQKNEFAEFLAGSSKSVCKLLDISDSENDKKLSLAQSDFDDNRSEYEDICGDRIEILMCFKSVYDWGILQQILKGHSYISYAKTEVYNKHKEDLKKLKYVIREYCSEEEYRKMFRSSKEKDNYCAYVGSTMANGKKTSINVCPYDIFIKNVKKIVDKTPAENPYKAEILADIERNNFLPKQVTKDNGVIPYQIHKNELVMILNNAKKYYDFLNEEDEYGSVADKIVSIMEFKIPYYVGPLNTTHKDKGFSWAVRKTDELIRPWNFTKVIDEEKSANQFIRRMTNKCTYLPWADVLPKDSIIYQTYMVLNELNNLKINDEKLTVEMKQYVFEELFKKQKKVTANQIIKCLETAGYINKGEKHEITGIDLPFKASMSSYYILADIFKNNNVVTEKIMEAVIFYGTIFGEEKNMFVRQLKNEFGNVITDEELNRIKGLNFKGWGNFSREFLVDITDVNKETGEYESILKALYNRQYNLMQLLGNENEFASEIERINRDKTGEQNGEICYSDVDELYISPSVKRAIWQVLLILKEIVKITGHEPLKIFIEMARGPENKGVRTKSRKQQLQNIYSNMKKDIEIWKAKHVVESLENKSDEELRQQKLYLWYTQLGRCMYSGKRITLEDLLTNNDKYDIDHIYPQSKIEDDSIMNNKVLVYKTYNSTKDNEYPLPAEWRSDRYNFWNMLKNNKLITAEKFKRLTRDFALTESEMTDFVARQLVETRQSTKMVAGLLEKYFGRCVVYVKAGNVSKFRQGVDDTVYGTKNLSDEEAYKIKEYIAERQKENQFIKCRAVNDFHHAKDAYLNIVVGNVYDTKYTRNPYNYIKNKIKNDEFKYHSVNAIYKFKVERNGYTAWEPSTKEHEGTMATVKKYMKKNNVLFTRQAIEKKHGQNGGFYDQNMVSAAPGLQPIKGSDERLLNTERYGGYKTVTPAYFMLVKYKDKKGKVVRRIETLPLYMKNDFENDVDYRRNVLKSFAHDNNLEEPEVLIDKIRFNSLIDINGFKAHLTGNNKAQLLFRNANQLVLGEEDVRYIKKLDNFMKRYNINKDSKITESDGITKAHNLDMYDKFINKLRDTNYKVKLGAQITTLEKLKGNFENISIEDQAYTLMEILNLFKCIAAGASLDKIGGGKGAGTNITISKNLSEKDEIYILNQSVTGLFVNKSANLTRI